MDAIDQFRQAMTNEGLPPPDVIQPGRLHKFPGYQKDTKNRAAWCFMFDDMRGGVFGDFSTNMESSWQAGNATPYTEAERESNRAQFTAAKAQRETDKAACQKSAATDAAQRLKVATTCTQHSYPDSKGVQCHGVKVEADGFLIVPMRDTAGKLWNIERINPADSKDKKGLYGGRRIGLFHGIGKPNGLLIVGEGYATCASIHEATGNAVAVAFNADNLEPVALALRAKYPALKIVVAADDDHLTDGNPGMTKARSAAQAVGGFLAVPSFPAGRPDKATDFNDLHQLAGAGAVKDCIEAAALCVTAGAADSDAWPDPTPLPDALPPVDPFDAELLPVALRAWVMDIANRMQCPADFSAVGAVAALSSLIGARAVVQPKERDDWQVVPNLWALVVGRPGVMKSPALGEVMKPLNRLEATERELFKAVHETWALDYKVSKIQDDANEKKAKGHVDKGNMAAARDLLAPSDTPTEPTARSYVETNTTMEALGVTLKHNPWGLIVYRDEIYSFLTTLDREQNQEARGFYLQGYDGNQGYKFKRITRDETWVDRVCIAMLGGIQPGKIERYVRDAVSGGNGDDGLLQRFGLTVWPDIAGEFVNVDQWPDTPAKQAAWAVFERLAQLQPATDTDPVVWRFSGQAQAIFNEWRIDFETEIRGDDLHPAMASHLAKYRKLIPALALLFALIDTPDTGGVIHEAELKRALAWGDYLRSHANRLYAAAVIPETTDAVTLLSRIKAGKLTDRDGVILDRFTPRQIAVKGWARLGTPDAVRKAADVLADYDWLRRDVVQSGDALGRGRPSDRYTVNPLTRGAV